MLFEPQLVSAAISVATGLVVALMVEGIVVLRVVLRRRSAVSDLREYFQKFKSTIDEAQASDDGMVSREQFQFALWNAHLDEARLVT